MNNNDTPPQNTAPILAKRLNWLRAGVLGANDGIISTAGLVVGVAAASSDLRNIVSAGIAGLVAGAVSMGIGEYVSVSTQRDMQTSLVEKEREKFNAHPCAEQERLASFMRGRGMSESTIKQAISEMQNSEKVKALLSFGPGIDEDDIANPWVAAGSSMLSFSLGAALPLLAILFSPAHDRIVITFIAVCIGLALTGWCSARLGGSSVRSAVIRLVIGGILAMGVTYAIGELVSTIIL